MLADYNSRVLADLVERTIASLDAVRLPLDMPGSIELEEVRAQLTTQLKTRILPHLRTTSLPAVVVLGGSSGAGKSTLFNTLIGEDLSPASVIRPTTRTPFIAIHPQDMPAMENHTLTAMGKVVNPINAVPGIVLVDAPDLDSVDAANRELSRRLLDAADLWLFVTTPSRYGDALAWEMLRDAHRRGMTTAVLLNRARESALDTVRRDIFDRMQSEGMSDTSLMVVTDAGPHEGRLDANLVQNIRMWLEQIAATKLSGTLVDKTTRAMLPELHDQLINISDAVEMQAHAIQDLMDKVHNAAEEPARSLEANASKGRYGQGAPTTSWLTLASTGGVLAGLASGTKPPLYARRNKTERDNAMTSVFTSVLASIRIGLTQALVAIEEKIWHIWRKDVIETEDFITQAHERINIDRLVREAENAWKQDLKLMSQTIGENPWLSRNGVAALIGAAAGGVSGAGTSLRQLGASDSALNARRKLAEHFKNAVNGVVNAYCDVLAEVPVGNGRQLRLRAAEYTDIYGL